MKSPEFQRTAFLVFLFAVTLAFGWVLWPYWSAVFWGAVLAILFAPLYRRLLRATGHRPNVAALLALLVILALVIVPASLLTAALIREGAGFYELIRSGKLDVGAFLRQIFQALPQWLVALLDRFDLTNTATLQARLAQALTQGSQIIARQAISIGQNTFNFLVSFAVMLYLLFFLLRDGQAVADRIRLAVPLSERNKQRLFRNFVTVTRATVKGNVVVAVVQGTLGGLMFWFLGIHGPLLWGALMAFMSLLPAVGAAIVWAPVAVYLLATGSIWQGVVLIVFGMLVIGLVDNVLRPILVGQDIKMPDYLVLVSTLSGISVFGVDGFVLGPMIAALFLSGWEVLATDKEIQQE
jgi:predicted PurR-regulated permease PerM